MDDVSPLLQAKVMIIALHFVAYIVMYKLWNGITWYIPAVFTGTMLAVGPPSLILVAVASAAKAAYDHFYVHDPGPSVLHVDNRVEILHFNDGDGYCEQIHIELNRTYTVRHIVDCAIQSCGWTVLKSDIDQIICQVNHPRYRWEGDIVTIDLRQDSNETTVTVHSTNNLDVVDFCNVYNVKKFMQYIQQMTQKTVDV